MRIHFKMAWFSKDLFPSKISFVYFISYMGLFINQVDNSPSKSDNHCQEGQQQITKKLQKTLECGSNEKGILVTASKSKSNTYSYNTVAVVLLTECLKLVAALGLYLRENSISVFVAEFSKNKQTLLYYFVPAGLYCFYNNLQFENLANYDPTTYYLLLQFRVVVTGIVFQIIFQKQLSRIQWVSLVVLTLGCIVKEYGRSTSKASSTEQKGSEAMSFWSYFDFHLFLILVQVFCSCFAGVYNEYLLKGRGSDIHIMMQNVFMYIDSIICNVFVLLYKGDIPHAFTSGNFSSIFQVIVICIMLNNATIGIIVSLFLRSLNSILKTFASALELMFTAVLCWIIFGIAIDLYTVIAICIVSGATFLYAQNPVVNKGNLETIHEKSGEENSSESKAKLIQSV